MASKLLHFFFSYIHSNLVKAVNFPTVPSLILVHCTSYVRGEVFQPWWSEGGTGWREEGMGGRGRRGEGERRERWCWGRRGGWKDRLLQRLRHHSSPSWRIPPTLGFHSSSEHRIRYWFSWVRLSSKKQNCSRKHSSIESELFEQVSNTLASSFWRFFDVRKQTKKVVKVRAPLIQPPFSLSFTLFFFLSFLHSLPFFLHDHWKLSSFGCRLQLPSSGYHLFSSLSQQLKTSRDKLSPFLHHSSFLWERKVALFKKILSFIYDLTFVCQTSPNTFELPTFLQGHLCTLWPDLFLG